MREERSSVTIVKFNWVLGLIIKYKEQEKENLKCFIKYYTKTKNFVGAL